MTKEERFDEARKGMMLKSLQEKRDREHRTTFSISMQREVKELLDLTAEAYGLPSSYIINEIIKRTLS